MGNISLFCLYNFTLLTGHNLRPIDPILMQLVIANATVLFSKGIPQTLAAFGWRYFLDDTGCKLVFYFHRVAMGVSFSTTCLFNGFQAIKLKPSIWRWMELQMRALRFIAFCCFLCWIAVPLRHSTMIPLTSSGLKDPARYYSLTTLLNLYLLTMLNFIYCMYQYLKSYSLFI